MFIIKYQEKLILAIAFILVSIISFGMGRLSIITENIEPIEVVNRGEVEEKTDEIIAEEHLFVGSRNSNKYHLLDCYWASKIKQENKIFFKNEQEANKMGYIPANCIKALK